MRILRTADRVPTAWKNGGGITFEVTSFPSEARLEDFGWRISMAEVRKSGPFSLFPNVDRTLAIIQGRLQLDVGGRGLVDLDERSPALSFPGDVPTSGKPLSDVVTDLNVMTRRGAYSAKVTRRSARGMESLITTASDITVVIALGSIVVRREGMQQKVLRRDALLFEKDERNEVVLEEPVGGSGLEYFLVEVACVN
jgi:uncharacterized protein